MNEGVGTNDAAQFVLIKKDGTVVVKQTKGGI